MEQGIPEWMIWLAGAFGTAMAAFVARMGWKAGANEPAGTSVQVEGALVDGSSVKMLAAAVEAINFTMLEGRKASEGSAAARGEVLLRITVALETIAAGIKQWNDFHEREEDERERREREALERKNERLTERLAELERRLG